MVNFAGHDGTLFIVTVLTGDDVIENVDHSWEWGEQFDSNGAALRLCGCCCYASPLSGHQASLASSVAKEHWYP